MSAIEITTFKLNKVTLQAFITANAPIDAWLKTQPGFQSRHIYQRSDGFIADVLFWENETAGTTAMHQLMDEHADSIIHGMINQSSVTWTIAAVAHSIIA